MSLHVTRFGDVIDWLIDALEDHPDLVDVQVSEGWADRYQDMLMIGAAELDQEWQQLGARTRDETVTVDINVYVAREGDTATKIRQRCVEIGDTVATVLRQDAATSITLGGLCTSSSLIPIRYTPGVIPDGRDGLLQLQLRAVHIRFP
jgi:hypothetical protein